MWTIIKDKTVINVIDQSFPLDPEVLQVDLLGKVL